MNDETGGLARKKENQPWLGDDNTDGTRVPLETRLHRPSTLPSSNLRP
jgi:hypothetical protein